MSTEKRENPSEDPSSGSVSDAVHRVLLAMVEARNAAAVEAVRSLECDLTKLRWVQWPDDPVRILRTELRDGDRVLWAQCVEINGLTMTVREEWMVDR